ncbi:MAG: hypothetical protein ABJA02_11355 [Acidobacteriota bacterium]
MADTNQNSLERFERHPTDYAQLSVGVAVFVCLAAAVILTLKAESWAAAVVVIFGILLLAGFIFLTVARDRRLRAASDRRLVKWDAAMPELQRQNVNLEVKELARLLSVDGDGIGELLSAYIVAQDLALRQIQQEENLPLLRHVQIGNTSFDAVLVQEDMITCVEVAFLVVPDVRQDKIESMLKRVGQVKRDLAEMKLHLRLRLMLFLVTQLTVEEEEHLRGMLVSRRFTDTPVDIDIRLRDFEELQRIYVTD